MAATPLTTRGRESSTKIFKLHGVKWEGTEGRHFYPLPSPLSSLPIFQYIKGQRTGTEFLALVVWFWSTGKQGKNWEFREFAGPWQPRALTRAGKGLRIRKSQLCF